MKLLFALLLACVPARAADLESARDNFDSIVLGYVAGRAEDGLWTLKQRGGAAAVKLRYVKAERDTVHSLGGGLWQGLAGFTDEAGKKRFHAEVTVSMRGDAWKVKSLKWQSGAEAAALRADFRDLDGLAPPPGPLPAVLLANAAANYDPARNMKADVDAALAEARRSRRRVLLDVGDRGCVWVGRMHSFIAADSEISDFKEKMFVTVLVAAASNDERLKAYGGIAGTPHLFVLGADGAMLASQDTEMLEEGKTYNHDRFLAFLAKWAPTDD